MVGTTAALVGSAIGAGGSLLGGLFGSRAANRAGELQAAAAQKAREEYAKTLAQYNPPIGAEAERTAAAIESATGAGQAGMREALAGFGTQTGAANELLAPYLALGPEAVTSLREFMAGPGAGMPSAQQVLEQDPGYQFRMQEAAKALQTSAAARGGALGGGTLTALNRRVQDVASSEYGSAFDRLRSTQADRFNRLSSLMGVGLGAAGQTGQNLLNLGQAGIQGAQYTGNLGLTGAQTAGTARQRGTELMAANALDAERAMADLLTGGAAAQAAGAVGSANAWQGALGGVGSAAGNIARYYQDRETLRELMRNPALTQTVV